MEFLKLKNNVDDSQIKNIVENYLKNACEMPKKLLKSLQISKINPSPTLYKCVDGRLWFEYAGRACVSTDKIYEEKNTITRKRQTIDVADEYGQIDEQTQVAVPIEKSDELDLWKIAEFSFDACETCEMELTNLQQEIYNDDKILESFAEKQGVKLALAQLEENFSDILLFSSRLDFKESATKNICVDVAYGKYKLAKKEYAFAINMNSGKMDISLPETISVKKHNFMLYALVALALIIVYIITGR